MLIDFLIVVLFYYIFECFGDFFGWFYLLLMLWMFDIEGVFFEDVDDVEVDVVFVIVV